MKKPAVVYLYTILIVLGILSVIGSGMSTLTNPALQFTPPYVNFAIYLSFVSLIPTIIFTFFFFRLKKSSLVWLYVSFGLGIVLELVKQNWIGAGLFLIFGWVVWDYISHKKIDGKSVFT